MSGSTILVFVPALVSFVLTFGWLSIFSPKSPFREFATSIYIILSIILTSILDSMVIVEGDFGSVFNYYLSWAMVNLIGWFLIRNVARSGIKENLRT